MKQYFTFASTDRRTRIHAVCWRNENVRTHAVVQLIHGMVEHIERYEEFAEYLADRGFIVVGHDHLGHGRSVVSEDEYGFFSEDQPALVLLQDIHRLRIAARSKFPGLPYFMLGHSMGSYLLRRYLSSQGDGLTGAVIVGTGWENEVALTGGLSIIRKEAAKYGWHYRSENVRKLTFGKYYKKFDPTGEDISRSWLSKNEENVRAYYEDPRCNFLFTLNGYFALLSTIKFDVRKKNIEAIPKDLPILIVSGDDDPVGQLGKGVKKTYNAFVKAGIRDVSCKLFENDRHEILNETDRQDVYAYLYDWLEKHSGTKEKTE